MSGLDLRSIEILAAVCDKGNMTEAARSLGMTQSAVSQQIKHMEELIGTTLVDRSLRPMRPTAAGEVLCQRGRRILAEFEEMRAIARLAGAAHVPQLRVGVLYVLSRTYLARLASHFASRSRPSNLMIWTDLDVNHGQALAARELDIIVTANSLDDLEGIVRHELVRETFIVVVPRNLLPPGKPLHLPDLAARLPFIRLSARTLVGIQIERHLRRLRIDAPRQYEFYDYDTVLAMVGEGLGWSIMTPLALLHGRVDQRNVRVAPFPGPEFGRIINLVARAEEFGPIPEKLANLSREILERHYLPGISALRPWLADKVAVAPQTALGYEGLSPHDGAVPR
jgi:molybdate transport repressor ModE-like protein